MIAGNRTRCRQPCPLRRPFAIFRLPRCTVVLVLLLAIGVHPRATFGQVIPPGQEQLLSALLGSQIPLPDGCTLADGQVDYTSVKATYHCPGGDVVVELAHPDSAPAGATLTRRFALSVSRGSPPPGLIPAIESTIRAKESAFQWDGW